MSSRRFLLITSLFLSLLACGKHKKELDDTGDGTGADSDEEDGGALDGSLGNDDGGRDGGRDATPNTTQDGGADTGIGPMSCAPITCEEKGAVCGRLDDGCGGVLSCGTCTAGTVCAVSHLTLLSGYLPNLRV